MDFSPVSSSPHTHTHARAAYVLVSLRPSSLPPPPPRHAVHAVAQGPSSYATLGRLCSFHVARPYNTRPWPGPTVRRYTDKYNNTRGPRTVGEGLRACTSGRANVADTYRCGGGRVIETASDDSRRRQSRSGIGETKATLHLTLHGEGIASIHCPDPRGNGKSYIRAPF